MTIAAFILGLALATRAFATPDLAVDTDAKVQATACCQDDLMTRPPRPDLRRAIISFKILATVHAMHETEEATAQRIRTGLRDALLTVDPNGQTSYLLFLTDDEELPRVRVEFSWDRRAHTIEVHTLTAYDGRRDHASWDRFVRQACVRRAKAAFAMAPRAAREMTNHGLRASDVDHIFRFNLGFRPHVREGLETAMGRALDGRVFWVNYEIDPTSGLPFVTALQLATEDQLRRHLYNTCPHAERTMYRIEHGRLGDAAYTYAPLVAKRVVRAGFTGQDVANALIKCNELVPTSTAGSAYVIGTIAPGRSLRIEIQRLSDNVFSLIDVRSASPGERERYARSVRMGASQVQ